MVYTEDSGLRLEFRAEGIWLNCYASNIHDAVGELRMGSVVLAAVADNPECEKIFVELMKLSFDTFMESEFGIKGEWTEDHDTPGHDRSGRA